MKKRVKDIVIAVIVMAVICTVMWNIGWISSFSAVAKLYVILIVVIGVSILIDYFKNKFVK